VANHYATVGYRGEHWTGLELDWIRATTNFVDLGLDLVCKCFINLGSGRFWTELMEKNYIILSIKICLLFFGFNCTCILNFINVLEKVGLGLSFKKSGLDLDRKI